MYLKNKKKLLTFKLLTDKEIRFGKQNASKFAYLAVNKWVQAGIIGRTNNFTVGEKFASRSGRRFHSIYTFAFFIRDGIVLPRCVICAVERTLQDPVAWSRGNCGLDDHVSHLILLKCKFVLAFAIRVFRRLPQNIISLGN